MVHDVLFHGDCRGTVFEDVAQAFAYVGNVAHDCCRSAGDPACRGEIDCWCFEGTFPFAGCEGFVAKGALV